MASTEPPGFGVQGGGLCVSQKAGVQRSLQKVRALTQCPLIYSPGMFPPVKSPAPSHPESHQQDIMEESPSPPNQSACEARPRHSLLAGPSLTSLDYYVMRRLSVKVPNIRIHCCYDCQSFQAHFKLPQSFSSPIPALPQGFG